MKVNVANPATGAQKLFDFEDERMTCVFLASFLDTKNSQQPCLPREEDGPGGSRRLPR